ncbi:putative DNA primase/helicase [Halalkaliarchaeum desulfuricum]|uniref:Putative DNA primase/helicase n=1 Tax=Halalkaliarchaeum desulfuricum TaxID=2055893 RepID=A0A343TIL2_9EURY|nr:hypothetical protein [Halalkaliarchaeum desulfuricum]AUX08934.1 putative DNA primase/helicase [Halalkaliarchaeum desulfuricum]
MSTCTSLTPSIVDDEPVGLDTIQEGRFTVPDSLEDEACWIVYTRKGDDKIPSDPRSPVPSYVDGTDPDYCVTFGEALDTVAESRRRFGHDDGLGGVGLCLGATDVCAIDLDDVIDEDGELDELAADLVDDIDSFTEVSPGGRGLHILVRDEQGVDDDHLQKDVIECYDERMMTFTGRTLRRASREIVNCPGLVGAYQSLYNGERDTDGDESAETGSTSAPTERTSRGELGDVLEDIVDTACEYDGDFEVLWNRGSTAWDSVTWNHDRSRADMSLASKIHWWCQESDAFAEEEISRSEMERIFLESDLAQRDKCQDRTDYVSRTFDKVQR